MSACGRCLRRSALVGLLGPRIAELSRAPAEEIRLILALPDEDLVRAVAPRAQRAVLSELRLFNAGAFGAKVAAAGLTATCVHDEETYPPKLRSLPDAPPAVFIRGEPAALAELAQVPTVALIGGRRASAYALEEAHELGRALAVAGVPVVSGLALGVDSAAHRGTLAAGGRAVAVLATGADVPYPRRHRSLYGQIAASGGAIISEMPPGTQAWRWAFPARNRIMAALATMIVVVEASERSGSLITASFAAAMGRDLGAVPGRVNARCSAGSNRLIADGAVPILGVEDILDNIFHAGARPIPPPQRVELGRDDEVVLDLVEAGESPTSTRVLDARSVRAALGRLEVLGLVRRDGLGGYERTGMRCQRT